MKTMWPESLNEAKKYEVSYSVEYSNFSTESRVTINTTTEIYAHSESDAQDIVISENVPWLVNIKSVKEVKK